MKNYLMLLISVFFFSCQHKVTKKVSVEHSQPVSVKENKEEIKQVGDTIFVNLTNEKESFTTEGILDSIHSRVYVKFKSEEGGKLNAKILPAGGKGNIRFNQIIFPDKTSDGPFGMDLEIQLKQKGNYIIVIGHSQMADNPYLGKFNVQLENKKE